MIVTVRQLAELVQGVVFGDGDGIITAARTLTEAGPGDITFLENPRQAAQLEKCQASAVVVPPGIEADRVLVQVKDPLDAFCTIFRALHGKPAAANQGIDPRAVIHPTAQLGAEANVGPFVSVGEGTVIGARCTLHPGVVIGRFCTLGDDVTIFPNAVLYDETVLGDRDIVHANAVIGSDGFGYRQQGGRHIKVPQQGNVVVGADVEIGAGSTIDRGTFTPTNIGAGSKIDNLVQIAHNCQIGVHNILCSQVGIAGSSTTGSYVVAAGQVGIPDHVTIGDQVVLGAQSGVVGNIDPKQVVMGTPARLASDWRRMMVTLDKLPEMRRDLLRVLRHLNLDEGNAVKRAAG